MTGQHITADAMSFEVGFPKRMNCSAESIATAVANGALFVVDVARRCRDAGVSVVRDGARLGDIGAVIEELARSEGCTIVREVGGHGIGRVMHAPPHVHHFGHRGHGMRLRAGMAFTIEPMVNLGGAKIRTLPDGWTIVTADGSLSAQFEHTVLVTKTGCEVMTPGEASAGGFACQPAAFAAIA